jgi:hypothetical protein
VAAVRAAFRVAGTAGAVEGSSNWPSAVAGSVGPLVAEPPMGAGCDGASDAPFLVVALLRFTASNVQPATAPTQTADASTRPKDMWSV